MRKKKKASIWIDFFLFIFCFYCCCVSNTVFCIEGLSITSLRLFLYLSFGLLCCRSVLFISMFYKGKEFFVWLRTIIQSLSFAYCQFLGMYSRWFCKGINTLEYYKELIKRPHKTWIENKYGQTHDTQ